MDERRVFVLKQPLDKGTKFFARYFISPRPCEKQKFGEVKDGMRVTLACSNDFAGMSQALLECRCEQTRCVAEKKFISRLHPGPEVFTKWLSLCVHVGLTRKNACRSEVLTTAETPMADAGDPEAL